MIDGDVAATEGDAGKQPTAAGVGIDLGAEAGIGAGIGAATDRPGSDRCIGAERHLLAVEDSLEAARRGKHEHDVSRLDAGLEADAPAAHRHHHRRAPTAVRVADTEHPLAVIDAEDEATLDHVREDRDPLGSLEHRRRHRLHLEGEELVERLLGRGDRLRFLIPRSDLRRWRGKRERRRPRPGSGGVVARRRLVGAGSRRARDRLKRRLLELHRLCGLAEGGQLGRGRLGEEEDRGDRAQAEGRAQTGPGGTTMAHKGNHGESFRAGAFRKVANRTPPPPPGRRQFPSSGLPRAPDRRPRIGRPFWRGGAMPGGPPSTVVTAAKGVKNRAKLATSHAAHRQRTHYDGARSSTFFATLSGYPKGHTGAGLNGLSGLGRD